MRGGITIVFLFMSTACLYGQKQGQELIDSLLVELEKANVDTAKTNILNSLSLENRLIGNIEIAVDQGKKALTLAEKIQFKKGAARAYSNIGIINLIQGNYPEALKHHFASLKIFEETGDKQGIAYAYHNISNIYFSQGNYPESLKNDFASLKIKEEIGDKRGVASSYNNIGTIYQVQGNHPEALKNYQESLKLREEIGYKKGMATSYNNIGIIYQAQGNYAEALKNLSASLKIKEEMGQKQGIAHSYINIGNLYTKLGNLRNSKEWLQKGLQLSKEVGVAKDIRDAYAGLAVTDSASGDYRRAYEHYKLYTVYKDSLFNEENTRKLTQTAMNYEFEKKQDSIHMVNEKEIAVRDASIASVRRQRGFFIGGLFAMGIIGGLLYHQSKQRKKHNEKLRVLNAELDEANRIKTRFFSILNHDLRSPVSNLIHFLHLKKESPELWDEDTKSRLEQKTVQGAENLLLTMEDLLLWSKGQMENFKPHLQKLSVDSLFDDVQKYLSVNEKVPISFENPDGVTLFTDENYLKTILRNLTSNAVRALQKTENPRIVWKASQSNGEAMLSISDNGPGADSDKFRALYDDKEVVGIKSGLGLHLIRDLATAIGCTIEVDTEKDKGTSIVLRFYDKGAIEIVTPLHPERNQV